MSKVIVAATVGFLLLLGGTPAFAEHDQPGADWMTRQQVTQKLRAAGYTSITELEADDGHWEGEGVKNGKIMDFHVDPHTGSFIKEEPDND